MCHASVYQMASALLTPDTHWGIACALWPGGCSRPGNCSVMESIIEVFICIWAGMYLCDSARCLILAHLVLSVKLAARLRTDEVVGQHCTLVVLAPCHRSTWGTLFPSRLREKNQGPWENGVKKSPMSVLSRIVRFVICRDLPAVRLC